MINTRREWMFGLGATLGTVALNGMLRGETDRGSNNPLAPKPGHLPARAKRCIFLYMAGGPSHIDTFDPKPELDKLNGNLFTNDDPLTSNMARGERRYVGSPFQFGQVGESGLLMCDRWKHLPQVADDLCIYRGCQGESVNHPTANLHMNTGNRFGGDPGIAIASAGPGGREAAAGAGKHGRSRYSRCRA